MTSKPAEFTCPANSILRQLVRAWIASTDSSLCLGNCSSKASPIIVFHCCQSRIYASIKCLFAFQIPTTSLASSEMSAFFCPDSEQQTLASVDARLPLNHHDVFGRSSSLQSAVSKTEILFNVSETARGDLKRAVGA